MKHQFVITGTIGVDYDWWTGQRGTTAKAVRDFLSQHEDEEVCIAVSSPGGFVDEGLEIYNAIKDHGKVNIHVIGMAASAASFLCMGAQRVEMSEGSFMLIHNASTAVMVWKNANKEQLDAIIAKFQKEREDLDTIDKVIASLYARRSGKSVEDCMAKMSRAAWLSPQDALDFGLIDSIDGEKTETADAAAVRNLYTNNIKNLGLPPFPDQSGDGSPTKSLLQKTVETMKAMFRHEPALNIEGKMKAVFRNVMALLAVTDGFETNEDSSVSLSQEQLQTIDNRLAAQDAEVARLQGELATAQDSLKTANETIENLKQAPGDETHRAGDNAASDENAFLAEAKVSFERIKDI